MNKKRFKGRSTHFRLFYYSHPYLVIFVSLIIYNLVLIALAALLMTYLMANDPACASDGFTFTFSNYLKNLEYCTVFTMNTGGIYDNAPNSVVIMKIILSVLQMITFTGALVGLATSMLQGIFDKRAHNVGRLRLRNHYVILNWSSAGANLIRELSFKGEKMAIVVLSSLDRDTIVEEIDNIFLDTGTEKKNITVFVKNGDPASRKALREVSIDKAKSIALLVPDRKNASDVDSFKLLMGIIGITKDASVAIEAFNEDVMKSMQEMIMASPELKNLQLTVFSKGGVVGHILARSAINSSYPDLYYSMLTYKNGSFYEVPTNKNVEYLMTNHNSCIPVARYNENDEEIAYALASSPLKTWPTPFKKEFNKEIPYAKNLYTNSIVLYVIGENDRSASIEEEVKAYNESGLCKIDLRVFPFDVDVDELLSEMSALRRRKKILILSDENCDSDSTDVNVFLTVLKLKSSHKLTPDVEISAEIIDQSNRSSLSALNVTNVIISNQMVALYMVQLMTHPNHTEFFHKLLSSKTDFTKNDIDLDVRFAEELMKIDEPLEFSSRAEFIQSLYKASNHEYIPIGFVDEKQKTNVVGAVTNAIGKTVGTVVNVAKKTVGAVTNMGAALNMDEIGQVEAQLDSNSRITLLSDHLSKKEKIVIKKGTIILLIHHPID